MQPIRAATILIEDGADGAYPYRPEVNNFSEYRQPESVLIDMPCATGLCRSGVQISQCVLCGQTMPRELRRFICIGALNAALDFAIFTLCVRGFGLSLLAANLSAWSVAVTSSYILNGRWTFERSWAEVRRPQSYIRFVLGNALSLIVATVVLLVLAQYMPALAAKAQSLAVGFLINFAVAKYLAFGVRSAR